ncbi:Methyltransferase domain-containing protein [Flavobacterium flevense]|uniref:Methyltransferase type 11 domain-containing protein n=1 Tax=Flavobacterium flevense TaxID=983 RepID=A0A4Y4B2N7_9FLAO|nr:class I SAM-dependent methyltransferase [Flavobacterium flevense]GEC73662.1 hypothetical protein FFL01_32010 [Flavobacterium flevense]SHL99796.1 Methyltransferase domain-containing protein [Flavobacterium flevense]
MMKISTGERLEFYDFSEVTVEHLHRYAIANDFVSGKVVLDIASGEGYGSYILSEKALEVIGVDIDVETIENSIKKYSKNNLKFFVGSADNIPVESNSIDVVVSFETIEHHDKHEEMLLEIKRVLKHDGILIMSSPDKKYYSDLAGQKNPFHVKELYFQDFKALVDQFFQFTNYYCQNSFNLNSFIGSFESIDKFKIYTGDENSINDNSILPVYNVVIASEINGFGVDDSFFNGIQIAKRIENRCEKKIKSDLVLEWKRSNTYKIGHLIIFPFYIIKKKLKRFFNDF